MSIHLIYNPFIELNPISVCIIVLGVFYFLCMVNCRIEPSVNNNNKNEERVCVFFVCVQFLNERVWTFWPSERETIAHDLYWYRSRKITVETTENLTTIKKTTCSWWWWPERKRNPRLVVKNHKVEHFTHLCMSLYLNKEGENNTKTTTNHSIAEIIFFLLHCRHENEYPIKKTGRR